MEAKKSNQHKELRHISLPENSNEVKMDYSVPLTEVNFEDTRLGKKSTEGLHVSEHDLADYRKRVSRSDTTLTSDEIKTLVSDSNERRRALQQSIAEQKAEFEQRRTAELEERYAKDREEAHQLRLKHESDIQRQDRERAEEETKIQRAKQIQSLENKCRKEKEQIETFYLQSSNKFNEKYGNPTLQIKISGDTGIDRIVTSRPFSTNRYVHRCIVCGYHFPESLSISKIYQHQFENQDSHMQQALNEVDKYYNAQISETRRRHAQEDNPTLRNQRLSKEIEGLQKLKGAHYL
jgi:hypothetical protein